MTTFIQYIESLDGGKRLRDSVRKDFIDLIVRVVRPDTFPDCPIETRDDLLWELIMQDADDTTLAAGLREWKLYKQWRRAHAVVA